MTFPFRAGTGPNFLNFGKMTRRKKEALILVIWNGRIRKTGVWAVSFFSKEAKEGRERKIHEQAGGENVTKTREGVQRCSDFAS